MSTALTAPAQPFNAADMATATKVFAFATMCIGMGQGIAVLFERLEGGGR